MASDRSIGCEPVDRRETAGRQGGGPKECVDIVWQEKLLLFCVKLLIRRRINNYWRIVIWSDASVRPFILARCRSLPTVNERREIKHCAAVNACRLGDPIALVRLASQL